MRVAVIIPTYNESGRVEKTVSSILDQNFDIVVVDDGSKDDTEALLKSLPITYLKHLVNRGQGAALKTGTEYALEKNYDVVVHFDADGQHRVEDLKSIIKKLEVTDLDVVLGSRFMNDQTEFPWQKKIILSLAKIFSNKILQLNFTDPQSGLRGFRLQKYEKMNWQKDDFQHCSEILSLVLKNNLKFEEIPIVVNYNSALAQKAVRPRLSMGLKLLLAKLFE